MANNSTMRKLHLDFVNDENESNSSSDILPQAPSGFQPTAGCLVEYQEVAATSATAATCGQQQSLPMFITPPATPPKLSSRYLLGSHNVTRTEERQQTLVVDGNADIYNIVGGSASTDFYAYHHNDKIHTTIFGATFRASKVQFLSDGSLGPLTRSFVVKIFEKIKMTTNLTREEDPLQEIDTMLRLASGGVHPNLSSLSAYFESADRIYTIMEDCGEELLSILDKRIYSTNSPFSEGHAAGFLAQIVRGASYMHERGLAHRDLSLENVLVAIDTNGNFVSRAKIIDFGMTRAQVHSPDAKRSDPNSINSDVNVIDEDEPAAVLLNTNEIWGKWCYLPPEIQNPQACPFKRDVYSCGVILYALLTGWMPFDLTAMKSRKAIIRSIKAFTSPASGSISIAQRTFSLSDSAANLLQAMLHPDPGQRPAMQTILQHEWFAALL